jgi:tRNA(Ile)-lysidine synthase
VTVRSRQGGERIRMAVSRPQSALMCFLRFAAVPPWERAALPLVFADDALAAVPGVGIAPAFRATAGAAAHALVWSPAAPAAANR